MNAVGIALIRGASSAGIVAVALSSALTAQRYARKRVPVRVREHRE
ncbi:MULTISPECIES: hypothetical protein [Nocardia]|nr:MULTISPECIES: hypothetical protein [Nocardia]